MALEAYNSVSVSDMGEAEDISLAIDAEPVRSMPDISHVNGARLHSRDDRRSISELNELARVDAGTSAMLCCTRTDIYLAGGNQVRRTGYDGQTDWEQTLDSPAIALLNADSPLIFSGTQVRTLS